MSILSSAPFPAFTLVLGCITGIASSHHVDADAIREAPAPSAHAAVIDEGGPVEIDSGSIGSRTIYRSADGLFYLTASVNGVPVRFLVDTGASVMVLRSADADAIGATARSASRTRIDGIGGSSAMAWTQVDRIAVGGKQVRGVRAAVARRGLSVSLLGQNLLARLGKVKIEGDRLDFE